MYLLKVHPNKIIIIIIIIILIIIIIIIIMSSGRIRLIDLIALLEICIYF